MEPKEQATVDQMNRRAKADSLAQKTEVKPGNPGTKEELGARKPKVKPGNWAKPGNWVKPTEEEPGSWAEPGSRQSQR